MDQAQHNLIHTWNLGLQVPSIFLGKGQNFPFRPFLHSLSPEPLDLWRSEHNRGVSVMTWLLRNVSWSAVAPVVRGSGSWGADPLGVRSCLLCTALPLSLCGPFYR